MLGGVVETVSWCEALWLRRVAPQGGPGASHTRIHGSARRRSSRFLFMPQA